MCDRAYIFLAVKKGVILSVLCEQWCHENVVSSFLIVCVCRCVCVLSVSDFMIL